MDDDGELHPAEAFGILGDETRVAILETLAAADQGEEEGLAFSELRERVGVRDAGQFNYHLDKLRDQFVVKRDGRYHPRFAALRAVGAIRSGTYTGASTSETADFDATCPECESSLSAAYDHGRTRMECPEHGEIFGTGIPPRAAADRSVAEIVKLADAQAQREVERAVDGTCFVCWGRVTPEVPVQNDADGRTYARLNCRSCWLSMLLPVGATALRHPAMVSFYHDHGVDVRRRSYLWFDFVRDPERTVVVSREPVRIRVRTEFDGDALSLTLDGDLDVASVEEP
ncbi:ArsR/SmtB family transcription factor [Halorussus halobius]|uniref:ArsR/SmtB family transcription factor n=1 Tax=Halorussus halobius TaxID=1710537 RepID=UPI001091BA6D|nr:winged helix-turn-helix domain-containing protein [Halorussus halobius]